MARCKDKLGKRIEARALYDRVLAGAVAGTVLVVVRPGRANHDAVLSVRAGLVWALIGASL